jgi:hypothetical protein
MTALTNYRAFDIMGLFTFMFIREKNLALKVDSVFRLSILYTEHIHSKIKRQYES